MPPCPTYRYICNVPSSTSKEVLASVFSPYGELESIRLVPKRRAAFANFTSITAAMHAREKLHGRPKPDALVVCTETPKDSIKDTSDAMTTATANERPLHINFTSSQQNCLRARTGRSGWSSAEDDGRRQLPHGNRGSDTSPNPHGSESVGVASGTRQRCQSATTNNTYGIDGDHGSRVATARPTASSSQSRGLYFGSLPAAATLTELANIVEKYGVIESLRLVRQSLLELRSLPHAYRHSPKSGLGSVARANTPSRPIAHQPCEYSNCIPSLVAIDTQVLSVVS